jgi:hypothetical protein
VAGAAQPWRRLRLSKPNNLLFEDQRASFPYSFRKGKFGKILSLLKAPKDPIVFGWFRID